ncbi:uncharacterized protein At1g76070-like [Tasmannia lanceolata]|uniref:uncharacterized protein At1g76070-like n=1 Tax=Tasmannia lanceolata TaxID=3420 RepID=UPI0040630BFE
MEKTKRTKSKILSFLPKTATISFANPPPSPVRQDNSTKFKPNTGKGFSGPISIIPAEARRKTKNGSFDTREPTSPKVSCIGQIKHKKRINKAKLPSTQKEDKDKKKNSKSSPKSPSSLIKIFRIGRKSDATPEKVDLPDRAPTLSQMKQFSSARNALADFEWKGGGGRNYYSDKDREEEDEEEEEFVIPHSAPLGVGGGVALEPRKEINIWKRRTMAPPRPLQLGKLE